MIDIKKHVYYCEFCKKRMLSKSAMLKHEKHCTMNPDRECRMCIIINSEQLDIIPLIQKYKSILKEKFPTYPKDDSKYYYDYITRNNSEYGKEILKQIIEDTKGCPMCTLSIIRQSFPTGLIYYDNYRKDIDNIMKKYNNSQT